MGTGRREERAQNVLVSAERASAMRAGHARWALHQLGQRGRAPQKGRAEARGEAAAAAAVPASFSARDSRGAGAAVREWGVKGGLSVFRFSL